VVSNVTFFFSTPVPPPFFSHLVSLVLESSFLFPPLAPSVRFALFPCIFLLSLILCRSGLFKKAMSPLPCNVDSSSWKSRDRMSDLSMQIRLLSQKSPTLCPPFLFPFVLDSSGCLQRSYLSSVCRMALTAQPSLICPFPPCSSYLEFPAATSLLCVDGHGRAFLPLCTRFPPRLTYLARLFTLHQLQIWSVHEGFTLLYPYGIPSFSPTCCFPRRTPVSRLISFLVACICDGAIYGLHSILEEFSS